MTKKKEKGLKNKEVIEEKEEDLGEFDESEEVLLLKHEIENLNEKIKKVQADSINYRKRKDEETSRMLKFANEDLILEILNIQNIFKEAFKNKSDNPEFESYTKGFKMIYENINNVLESFGVKKIDSLGKEFDYNKEEAIVLGHDNSKKDNIVLEVFRDGYTLYDKVIIPSQVKVNQLNKEEK